MFRTDNLTELEKKELGIESKRTESEMSEQVGCVDNQSSVVLPFLPLSESGTVPRAS